MNSPVVFVVGETASGKSDLAMELARLFDGELICADATTVYTDFDIGTAKPTEEERKTIAHHMLDVADARKGYSAPEFQRAAIIAIQDIRSRGKLPIIVGGTGLYIDSLLYDYGFLKPSNPREREYLNSLSLTELLEYAHGKGLNTSTIDERNKRRVIRLIENDGMVPERKPIRADALLVGLTVERRDLEARIEARVDAMLAAGLKQEVETLSRRMGWDAEPMKAIGYREWREYFDGSQSLEVTRLRIVAGTRRLAKKQRTWFKRNNSIHWFANRYEAVDFITTVLNK